MHQDMCGDNASVRITRHHLHAQPGSELRSAVYNDAVTIRINTVHVLFECFLRPARLSDVQSLQPLIK